MIRQIEPLPAFAKLICLDCGGTVVLEHSLEGDDLTCILCARRRPLPKQDQPSDPFHVRSKTIMLKAPYLREFHHQIAGALYKEEIGLTKSNIMRLTKLTEGTVEMGINQLEERGIVETVQSTGRRKWKLTERGNSLVI